MVLVPVTTSLKPMLEPESIAVIGASPDVAKMGGRCVKYLLKHRFPGRIYPVNPRYQELQGLACYPSVTALPETPDLALVILPGHLVPGILEECVQKGVPSALVLSSGFAEVGGEGAARQRVLQELARRSGMRICGPNCNGIINVTKSAAISSIPTLEHEMVPGPVGLITQSGGIGFGSLWLRAMERRLGFSMLVSTGNEADADSGEFLEYMVHDPDTRVILMILEGIRNPQSFLRAADLARAHRKPVVVLKLGQSESGARVSQSHTASLTGSAVVQETLFRQKGIIQVKDLDEMLDVATLLSFGRVPPSRRLAIMSPSGGAAVLAADKCDELGLELPDFSPRTKERLAAVLPDFGNISNPLDLTAQAVADPSLYEKCLAILAEDENTDIVAPVLTVAFSYRDFAARIVQVFRQVNKPIVTLATGGGILEPGHGELDDGHAPLFPSITSGLKAIAALCHFGAGTAVGAEETAAARATPEARAVRDGSPVAARLRQRGRRVLTEDEAKLLLADYGIPVTQETLVTDADAAVAAARRLGGPVALKGVSAKILHKTDAGIVRLNLQSDDEIRAAYDDIVRAARAYDPAADLDGVLVQEMVPKGTEVIIGINNDPQFGPVLLFGLGGIFVEVFGDVSRRVLPILRRDAEEMVREIRGYKILQGFRGAPPADVDAIVDALLSVARLASDHAEWIEEIDINPLMVFPAGQGLKAVDALMITKGT